MPGCLLRLFALCFWGPPLHLTQQFEELLHACEVKNFYLVMGWNSNSHHTVWGSTNCNDRGVALLGFLNSMNLEILNQGDYPTFCSARRLEVIDINLGSFWRLDSFKSWEVYSEPYLSDQTYSLQLFNLEGCVLAHLIRNPRGSNWYCFWEQVKGRLDRAAEINVKDKAGLGLQFLCSAGHNFGLRWQMSS